MNSEIDPIEKKRIYDILVNKGLRFVSKIVCIQENINCDKALVIFREKDKIKIGYIHYRYYHRYGIDVFCVKHDDRPYPWFRSRSMQECMTPNLMAAITTGDLSSFREFRIDELYTINF